MLVILLISAVFAGILLSNRGLLLTSNEKCLFVTGVQSSSVITPSTQGKQVQGSLGGVIAPSATITYSGKVTNNCDRAIASPKVQVIGTTDLTNKDIVFRNGSYSLNENVIPAHGQGSFAFKWEQPKQEGSQMLYYTVAIAQ